MERIARIGRVLMALALVVGAAGCGASRSGLRPVERAPEVDIHGRVQTPDGPAASAFVVLKPARSLFKAYTYWTLSDGTFQARGLPPGEYTVEISLDGYLPAKQRRNFSEGGGVIDVTLQPTAFKNRANETAGEGKK